VDPIENKIRETKSQWRNFISGSHVDHTMIPRLILESWMRSKKFGVDPCLRKNPHKIGPEELQQKMAQNEELLVSSAPIMNNLKTIVQGTGFIVILTDAQGYILKSIGDYDIIKMAKKGGLVPGSCWDESHTGTNGIGTVIKTGMPVQVIGSEHYCILNHRWTCSGAPIRNSNGSLIGVLDMTGPYRHANPHTLGIVVAAANAVDNLLRLNKALQTSMIYQKTQDIVLSTIEETIFSVDDNGCITLSNKNITEVIGLSKHRVVGKSLETVFGQSNNKFIQKIKNNSQLSDSEVRIMKGSSSKDYILTIRRIHPSETKYSGKVVILRAMDRTKKFVTHMMGANALFSKKDIIGANSNFLKSLYMAEIAANNPSNVLLTGESGTGKDVFAQLIHNKGTRNSGPYIAINCAAIPKDLIASELFGHEEGAFTGSKRGGNPGKFELASGGTLLLDEIGEMPLALQTTLLRVLEEKKITRIGGEQPRPLNVRIITATNKNLQEEITKGNFRSDLFYRINVFPIHLIPLRERTDDIPLLINHFVNQISERMNNQIQEIDNSFIQLLCQYTFPGNVRELQNIIERSVNLATTNILTPDLLPPEISDTFSSQNLTEEKSSLGEVKHTVERNMIEHLIQSDLPKTDIAKKLNISRRTLYRKLQKYNLR